MEAEIIKWLLGVIEAALFAALIGLWKQQKRIDTESHTLALEVTNMRATITALQSNHDKLYSLTTEQNYRFENKLERLSDKVETKADK